MKYILTSTVFFFLFIGSVISQRAVKIHSHKNNYFTHQPEFLIEGKTFYFSGNLNSRGEQIFYYNGDNIKQITHFASSFNNEDIKVKHQNPIALGAVSKNLTYLDGSLFFFAKGELTPSGIYRYNKGVTKMVFPCKDIGDIAVHGNEIYADVYEVIQPKRKKDSTFSTHSLLKITTLGQAKKIKNIKLEGISEKLCSIGEDLYLFNAGKAYLVKEELKQVAADWHQVQEPFSMKGQLYFTGYKNNDSKGELCSFSNSEIKTFGNIIPNRNNLDYFMPLVVEEKAYFQSFTNEYGNELFVFDGKNDPEIVIDLSTGDASTKINSVVGHKGQIFISAKASTDKNYNLYQNNKDGIVKANPRYMRNVKKLMLLDDLIYFYGSEGKYNSLYAVVPGIPPFLTDYSYEVLEFSGYGTEIGTIKGVDQNKSKLKYKILEGNKGGAFKLDMYTGELEVNNSEAIKHSKNPSFTLIIECKNKSRLVSTGKVVVKVVEAERFSKAYLQEKLLFFPDFSVPGKLESLHVADGEVVKIFNFDFIMVDKMVVRNGYIQLGKYSPGMYIINVTGGKNYYQKIEIR